mgnify:CR=1 FL=1
MIKSIKICKILIALQLSCFSFHLSQSLQEMGKVKADYEKILQKDLQRPQNNDFNSPLPLTNIPNRAEVLRYMPEEDSGLDSDYYGYDFFTKRDTIAFWANLPAPSNYLLGAGDELVISLWGATQLRQTYIISREGTIYDEKVGLLNLSGKTMKGATTYLSKQFGKVYATLKGRSPTTYIDISLGKLRSINVSFVGEVKYPGIYPIHPFSTIITGLIQAGGIDTTGTLRNIIINRNGKLFSKIDLYDYFFSGDVSSIAQLRDQDVVVVPIRNNTVSIDSAVYRPGKYESDLKESVHDIIQYAGGLKPNASNTISLERKPFFDKYNNNSFKENIYVELQKSKLILAKNGDKIIVQKLHDEKKIVQLIGQVKAPGFYNFYNGMTLSELFKLGSGFEDTTFFKSVYSSQAEIIRRNPSNKFEDIIKVNLKSILDSNSSKDYYLQNLDRVVIHANSNYYERLNIKVSGEVRVPGDYPLLSNNESLKSIIRRSGGLTELALKNGIAIYRDKKYFDDPPEDYLLNQIQDTKALNIDTDSKEKGLSKIKLGWKGINVNLMPGDSIVIRARTGSVYVTGEIYSPGLVEYQKGKSLGYYIASAGGINNYGDKNNVVVVMPNGITQPKRMFRNVRITDGSIIVVYRKADISQFDVNQFASTTASLLSSLVTIFVLYQQISSGT